MPSHSPSPLSEVVKVFLWLGFTAFGGPAAHISLFRREFVEKRKWLSDAHFLDLLAATNLIPGPNSTEMAIHLGYYRAGWAGMIAAGVAFTLPAVLIVLSLAWAYAVYGATPQATWLLYGIKPVMIAIIAQVLWEMGKRVFASAQAFAVALTIIALYFLGVNEVALIFLTGLVHLVVSNWRRAGQLCQTLPVWLGVSLLPAAMAPFDPTKLFLVFLKIGSILYGSGYVLVAFLRADLVSRLGWLTEQQLVDAVAIGQMTPGPLFTTATFIGYQLHGLQGAMLATVGISLPSFIFVALSKSIIPKLRASAWAGKLLDGVVIASLALMAAVGFQLGLASIIDLPTALIFLISLSLILRYKVDSTWLILGGAAVGYCASVIF